MSRQPNRKIRSSESSTSCLKQNIIQCNQVTKTLTSQLAGILLRSLKTGIRSDNREKQFSRNKGQSKTMRSLHISRGGAGSTKSHVCEEKKRKKRRTIRAGALAESIALQNSDGTRLNRLAATTKTNYVIKSQIERLVTPPIKARNKKQTHVKKHSSLDARPVIQLQYL